MTERLLREIKYLPQGQDVGLGLPTQSDYELLSKGKGVWELVLAYIRRVDGSPQKEQLLSEELKEQLEVQIANHRELLVKLRSVHVETSEKEERNRRALEKCNVMRNRIEQEHQILNGLHSLETEMNHLIASEEITALTVSQLFKSFVNAKEELLRKTQDISLERVCQLEDDVLDSQSGINPRSVSVFAKVSLMAKQKEIEQTDTLQESSSFQSIESLFKASIDEIDERCFETFLISEEHRNCAFHLQNQVMESIAAESAPKHKKIRSRLNGLEAVRKWLTSRIEEMQNEVESSSVSEEWLRKARERIDLNEKQRVELGSFCTQLLNKVDKLRDELDGFSIDSNPLLAERANLSLMTASQLSSSLSNPFPVLIRHVPLSPVDLVLPDTLRETLLDYAGERIEAYKDCLEHDLVTDFRENDAKVCHRLELVSKHKDELIFLLDKALQDSKSLKDELDESFCFLEDWKSLPAGSINIQMHPEGSLPELKKQFEEALERAENSLVGSRSIASNPESLSFSPIPKRHRKEF